MAPRIAYKEYQDWDDAVKSLAADGNPLNIFKTLANHPKLMKRWVVFANHVLSKSTLSPRDREIVILRIGWNCQSEYEWGQHVAIGKKAGISDEEIVRLTSRFSSENPGWTENEKLLIEATDELKAFSKISNKTWAGLEKYYSNEQLMDVVFAVGQYNLVSMFLNTMQVERDEGVVGFPDRVSETAPPKARL